MEMRTCVPHGIAGDSAEIYSLLSGVLNSGVNSFNFVGRIFMNFPLLTRSLYFVFFNIPLLLCFLSITRRDRRPHFSPNRFRSQCDLCFGQSAIYLRVSLMWSLVQAAESRGSAQNFQREFYVHQISNKSSILLSSQSSKSVWFVSRRQCI